MTVTKMMLAATLCVLSALSFAESKVAILDPTRAVMSSTEAKAQIDKLVKSADYAATKAKLDGIQADAKALGELAKKEGATWSPEKQAEQQKKLQNLQQDYEFNGKKLQKMEQEEVQKIMQALGTKAEAAVKQVIDAEKIGLLLDSKAAMHASPEFDITAKVTDAINKAK